MNVVRDDKLQTEIFEELESSRPVCFEAFEREGDVDRLLFMEPTETEKDGPLLMVTIDNVRHDEAAPEEREQSATCFLTPTTALDQASFLIAWATRHNKD